MDFCPRVGKFEAFARRIGNPRLGERVCRDRVAQWLDSGKGSGQS